jgi:hypothetical protein
MPSSKSGKFQMRLKIMVKYGEHVFFFETWDEMGQSVNEDSLATYAN